MNYYEKNLECIKTYRETLYLGLKERDSDEEDEFEDMYTIDAKDGNKALVLKSNDTVYRLNSIYYPIKEAKQWSEQYKFSHINSIIIMFGFGNGIFVRELINNKKKDDIIFIYEPSYRIFRYVLEHYDITDIIKQDNVAITVDTIYRTQFFTHFEMCLSITNFSSQEWLTHPYYNEIFKEKYEDFHKDVKEHSRHALIVINTRKSFGAIYLENLIKNFNHIRTSNRLSDYIEYINLEIPAIIVAAGPSLKLSIDEIKKLKGRAYIFVVDRILDYVLDSGLEPDFIVTVDPIKPIEYVTRRRDITIPIICKLDSNWEILNAHKGKKIICASESFMSDIYTHMDIEPPMLDLGNSVATVAFAACEQLGFKTIVLAGQDLSYDGEFTHVGEIKEVSTQRKDIYVEGLDGKPVKSRWDWYEFLRWYKIKLETKDTIQVIDIKPRGAKISGTINLPIDIVSKDYCREEFNPEILKSIKPTFSEDDMIEVSKFIKEGYEQLEEIKELMEKSIELSQEQIRGYKRYGATSSKYKTRFKKISKINKKVMDMPMYRLLEYMVHAQSSGAVFNLYQSQEKNNDEILSIYENSISIYQTILESIEFVKPLMKEALCKI